MIKRRTSKHIIPYKGIPIGHHPATESVLQVIRYNATELSETENVKVEDLRWDTPQNSVHWMNIHGLTSAAIIDQASAILPIDNLTLQYILDTTTRPKVLDTDRYIFFTFKSIDPADTSNGKTQQVSFVLGKNILLSIQERKNLWFDHIRERIRQSKGIVRQQDAGYLLFLLIESVIDNYYLLYDSYSDQIESVSDFSKGTAYGIDRHIRIETLKKHLHNLRKIVFPLKESLTILEMNKMDFISEGNLKYYTDLKDHIHHLVEEIDFDLGRLDSASNLFYSVQGHRLNETMRILTAITGIFIPLTLITGIYGMNFEFMPELQWKYGYFATLAILLTLLVGSIVLFKRKHWL